jgi:hypothetical protein
MATPTNTKRTTTSGLLLCCYQDYFYNLPAWSNDDSQDGQKMDNMFHRTTDTIPHIDLVIKVKAPYDCMFEQLVALVTDDRDINPPTQILDKTAFLLDKDYVIS